MVIRRRQLLGGMITTPFLPLLSQCGEAPSNLGFLSAFKRRSSAEFGLAALDTYGRIRFEIDLPARGHGFATHPKKAEFVAIARRPGQFFMVCDPVTGSLLKALYAPKGRHYYGHAVYSADGQFLYTTENAFDEDGQGKIGLYETHTYARIGEMDAYGIGPHEVILMPDRRTLAVAIGGIQTHPSAPRQNLNVDTMAPALCFIDSQSGQLLKRWEIPNQDLHKLSIRHISVNHSGQVAAAFQWEGKSDANPPLVGICDPKDGWSLLHAPDPVQKAKRLYCGSVAFAQDGKHFMVTAPRGNLLTQWRADGKFISAHTLADGCGVTKFGSSGFMASSGLGGIETLNPAATLAEHTHMWDNHMLAI